MSSGSVYVVRTGQQLCIKPISLLVIYFLETENIKPEIVTSLTLVKS